MNLQDNEILRNKVLQIYAYQMMLQNFQNNVLNQKNDGLFQNTSFYNQNIRTFSNFPINFENPMYFPPKDILSNVANQPNEHSNKNLFQDSMNNSSSLKSMKSKHLRIHNEGKKVFSSFNPDKDSNKSDLENHSFKDHQVNNYNKVTTSKFVKRNKKKHFKFTREKRFKCDLKRCKKRFFTEYHLKVHKRVHRGVRPYKCDFPLCSHSFYDWKSHQEHKKNGHIEDKKQLKFYCGHQGCTLRFKTKKQKLSHHNKLELECKEEKNVLIKLVSKFNKTLFSLAKGFKLDLNEVEKLTEIEDLKLTYEKTTLKLQDPDFFFFCVGDKLQFPSLINN